MILTLQDEMAAYYDNDTTFHEYVDSIAKMYDKTVPEVLALATTREVYRSYQRGGCNARDK